MPTKPQQPLNLTRSEQLLAQARALVPGETVSLMKRPEMFAPGAFPVFLESGEGAVVRDVDGNEYIDFVCGLGANTLGHNHPAVLEALRAALPDGLCHSLPTPLELDAARAVVSMTPGADMARFFKTGADATSAAIRLARHITGKQRVIAIGYNGWHDHFMFDTPGVPPVFAEYTLRMPLLTPADEPRLLDTVEQCGDELAAVLLSLPYNRCVEGRFLHALRAACRAHNVLFILDEVVTGFRLARGGAQEFYDLRADAVCLSKGIAAGMPLSAVVGPRETLAPLAELQVSTTFGGERLSLAACVAALGVYRDSDAIAHLTSLGERLRDGVNRVAERVGSELRVCGYAAIPFFRLAPDPETQAARMRPFVAAMARRGVLLRRDVSFICAAHTEDQIDHTVAATGDALRELSA